MKRIVLMVLIFSSIGFFTSCQKETAPVPQNVADCPPPPPTPPTKLQILTAKPWQIRELRRNEHGTNTYFIRGGANTTGVTYQNMRFIFNEDGTGTYVDEVSTSHTMDWQYTTADERNMSLVVGPPFAFNYTWTLIGIEDAAIFSTSSFNNGLLSAWYEQVPE